MCGKYLFLINMKIDEKNLGSSHTVPLRTDIAQRSRQGRPEKEGTGVESLPDCTEEKRC